MSSSPPPAKEQSYRRLNHELRDVISILTGLGQTDNVGADDAMGIITLAGSNKGAMMKMEGPGASIDQTTAAAVNPNGGEGTEAFANSNYQSINNSIVIGGSCGAEDPGVHLLIQDYVEGDDEGVDEYHERKSKEKKKDREKEKEKKGKSEDEKQSAEGEDVNKDGEVVRCNELNESVMNGLFGLLW